MEIYLDNIIFFLQKSGGISVYWSELIRGLIASGQLISLIEPAGHSCNIFYDQKIISSLVKTKSIFPSSIERLMPIRAGINSPAIIHSSYYRIMHHRNAANIVTVHDFTYELYREGIAKHMHHWQKRQAILHADGIICVSENTKADLLRYFPEVPEKIIRVIYHGVSNAYKPLTRRELEHYPDLAAIQDKKYILYVGDRRGYKNFHLAVEGIARYGASHLVIVGGGSLSIEEITLLEQRLPNQYHYLGNIDNEKLNIIYNSAFCLLHPSAYEGFGIAVLEAMAAGCPVIALCTSSIPEVCGGACLCVKSAEPEAFVEKIKSLDNSEYREHIIDQGNLQSRLFTWEKCVAETLAVYREVYAERFGKHITQ